MRLFRRSGSSTRAEYLLLLALALKSAGGGLVENTLETGGNLFDSTPAIVLGSGLSAAAGISLLETGDGCSGFLPGRTFSALDRADDLIFGPALPVTSAGVWLAGIVLGNGETEAAGEELCRGLVWTYGITAALKYSVGRTRPDGDGNLSFPSAHAAGASCAAAVLWSRYGPEAGIPAAAAALYTCLSRVNMGRHFPSDVVAGAALGTACGLAASLDDEETELGGPAFGFTIDTQGRIVSTIW